LNFWNLYEKSFSGAGGGITHPYKSISKDGWLSPAPENVFFFISSENSFKS
jgi:hypothetical protein